MPECIRSGQRRFWREACHVEGPEGFVLFLSRGLRVGEVFVWIDGDAMNMKILYGLLNVNIKNVKIPHYIVTAPGVEAQNGLKKGMFSGFKPEDRVARLDYDFCFSSDKEPYIIFNNANEIWL